MKPIPPPVFEGHFLPQATTAILAEALRDAIARGVIPAGAPLRQDQIAAQFRVSHIPVREALKQLVSEGLAVLVHKKGVVVASLSPDEVSELTEYRCLLEGQLTRWAVPRLCDEDFVEASHVLDELDRVDDVDEMLRLNAEFHAVLYRRVRRPFFLQSIERVRVNLGRYWRLAWLELDHKPRSQDEHRRILRFCRARRTEDACDLIVRHIRATGRLVIDYLRRETGDRDLRTRKRGL